MLSKHIKIDKSLVLFLILFFCISILSIYSASIYLSSSLGNLVFKQISWYILGIIMIILLLKLKLDFILKLSPYIYFFNVLLLLGLLFLAPEINGSKCWYVINGLGSIQPSEFMKISLLLFEVYIIRLFKKNEPNLKIKKEFLLILVIFTIFALPSLVTFLEPDTGAVIIYFITTVTVLFISGIRMRWFYLSFVLLISFVLLFLYLYFLKQNTFINIFGSDFFYRMDRIINWNTGSGMQLENSLTAIGSSGLLGHGFNNTPIYFPEAGTDFIFTVFSSNFGLIGSIFFIVITLLFDLHIIKIAINTKKIENKCLLSGIIAILFYQQIQNISMTIGLLPITGITLPFISYGGSSLLSYMLLIGLCIQVYNK